MPGRDIIVIGCSAGGVQALQEIVRGLPENLPAAVFVVMHTSPASPGILPQILDRAGPLPADHASDGAPIRHGRIYVAPPDHHLLLKRGDGGIRVVHGPRENGFRPAVDPLFRTAAAAFRRRVVGVVLSGGLDDGTEGLMRIKSCGGAVVVQDPEEAIFPSMPAHAIRHVECDHVVPLAQIPSIIAQYATEPIDIDGDGDDDNGAKAMSDADCPRDDGLDVAEVGSAGLRTRALPGAPSGFTCPECGGTLWELTDEGLLRYRCHVGHAYTAEGLTTEHARRLEMAMWTALRALEENSAIRRRMAERSKGHKWKTLAGEYERQARESEERVALIREVLVCDDIEGRADADVPRRPDAEIPGVNTTGGEGNGERGNGKSRRIRSGKKARATSHGAGGGSAAAGSAAAKSRPSTKSSKSASKTRSKPPRA